MTNYHRLVIEWQNVRDKFAGGHTNLAAFLRTKGIHHSGYLRHVIKHTECLAHGNTTELHLAHAERQLALYKDKEAKQIETGAKSIRTEVVGLILGGVITRAADPRWVGRLKLERSHSALLKALDSCDSLPKEVSDALKTYEAEELKRVKHIPLPPSPPPSPTATPQWSLLPFMLKNVTYRRIGTVGEDGEVLWHEDNDLWNTGKYAGKLQPTLVIDNSREVLLNEPDIGDIP